MSQRKLQTFSFLLLLIGLSSMACQPPCQQLQQAMCKALPQPELCKMTKQELKKKRVSTRKCRALLQTWPTEGKKQLEAFSKRYDRYHNWLLQTHKMRQGLRKLSIEQQHFRISLQKLLGTYKPIKKKKRKTYKKKHKTRKKKRKTRKKKRKTRKKKRKTKKSQ